MVEKASEVIVPESRSCGETAAAQPDTITAQHQDLSVFNFISSSQDSGSSCSQRCKNENRNMNKKKSAKKNAASRKVSVQGVTRTTRKQTRNKMKKDRLEAINKQWGITEEVHASGEKEQPSAEGAWRSSKRVSFLSPAVMSEEDQPKMPQGSTNELSPCRGTPTKSLSLITELNGQTQPVESGSDCVVQHDKLSANDPNPSDNREKWDNLSPLKLISKRSGVEEKIASLETTPKRPRASPGRRRKSQMSPAVLSPPSSASPGCDKSIKNSRVERGDSPSVFAAAGRKSPRSPGASVGRPTSGSPAVMKRNHKGETLLHQAAIKVESSEYFVLFVSLHFMIH